MELLFCLNTSCIIPYGRILLILYQNVLAQFNFSDGIALPGLEEKSRQPLYFLWGGGRVAYPRIKTSSWQLSWGCVIGNSVWTKRGKRVYEWEINTPLVKSCKLVVCRCVCLPLTMFRGFLKLVSKISKMGQFG